MKSDHVEEVKNNVLAEKSFVYFDTKDYKTAFVLINQLKSSNYKYIPIETKAWIVMQEGYILMLNKKYLEAEKTLDEAITVLKDVSPSDLPNIYGKKMELYNEMKQYNKRDATFELALANTKKHKKIKYEMYLYQVKKNIYKKMAIIKMPFKLKIFTIP